MIKSRLRSAVIVAGLTASAAVLSLIPARAFQTGGTAQVRPAPDTDAPWPSPAVLTERRRATENLPLFASDTPLEITLIADFGKVQRDRDPESTTTYPATLTVARADGGDTSFPVRIRTRGHMRRKPTSCTFAPLRIEFESNPIGTPFEGQKNLKLGTHCRDTGEYPEYVAREYPVYRMFNILTPQSFRARLAEAHYVDAKDRKPVRARTALFLEDDDDVARRLEARTVESRGLSFSQTDDVNTTLMMVFEYMIGNTDISITSLHNVIVARVRNGTSYLVPYDFDYSGVVNAQYAVPASTLRLSSVRERLYRGPCHTAEELEPVLQRLRAARTELLGVYDSTRFLKPGYVAEAKKYLEQFFRTIDNPASVKKAFIDGCTRRWL
jgi:hypothetical protein